MGSRRTCGQILGLGEPIHVAVIGAGNLGQALADYPGFPRDGFVPVALFDRASAKVGTALAGRGADLPRPAAAGDRAQGADPHRDDRGARAVGAAGGERSPSRPGFGPS